MPQAKSLALRLQEAEAALEIAKAARGIAESALREQREFMTDLLLQVGNRKTCAKCNAPVFWVLPRGATAAIAYNCDGTQHWPRCPATARPPIAVAAGGE